jgi:hypothetical protein
MALPFIVLKVDFGGGFARHPRRPGLGPGLLVNVPVPEEFLISGAKPDTPFSKRCDPPPMGSLCLDHTF